MGAGRTGRDADDVGDLFEGQVRDVVEIEHLALPRRQAIDRRPDGHMVGALGPCVIGAVRRESGKQQRKSMAPAMLLHRESVHRAIEPSQRALDELSTPDLAPEAQDRLLERIGRLLIAQAQVAREVIEGRSVSVVELGPIAASAAMGLAWLPLATTGCNLVTPYRCGNRANCLVDPAPEILSRATLAVEDPASPGGVALVIHSGMLVESDNRDVTGSAWKVRIGEQEVDAFTLTSDAMPLPLDGSMYTLCATLDRTAS